MCRGWVVVRIGTVSSEERFEKIERTLDRLAESHVRQDAEITKQNDGIKALIVVARTVLDSVQELRATQERNIQDMREMHRATIEEMREMHRATIEEMREWSKATDEKLNILVDTVDKIIRRNGSDTHL